MGKVIPIVSVRVEASDPVLQYIDECYSRLAQHIPNFRVRSDQVLMSKEACKAMLANEPLAIEAPTGTGKTLAYLIGALAASEKLRTSKEIPIVIATATVGLQSQILQGDLPMLVKAKVIPSERQYTIAKGRSRYFCVKSAERLAQANSSDGQFDFFNQATNDTVSVSEQVNGLLAAWNEKSWDGDVDTLKTSIPACWSEVAASTETCLGHKCEHYSECSFFASRRVLSEARIIVSNHDMVLADLAMAKEGADPLFPGPRYLVVFDEAHHLPNKAIDIGSANLRLDEVITNLGRMTGFSKSWIRSNEMVRMFEKAKLDASDFEVGSLLNALAGLVAEIRRIEVDSETGQLRFPGGQVPANIAAAAEHARDMAAMLSYSIQEATSALKKTNLAENNPSLKGLIGDLLYQCAFFNSHINSLFKGLTLVTSPEKAVRWVQRMGEPEKTSIHVSPFEGAEVLRKLMWDTDRVVPVMVSATIQDTKGFSRFRARCGLGDNMRELAMGHVFPYHESKLVLVNMTNTPRQAERKEFLKELAENMPDHLSANEGSLILFPSKSMMLAMLPTLRGKFGNTVLAQGERGIKELVADHKARIDAGRGSILCGLATMAEGLDLPGAYCVHVVICALPFSVPTSPVERELAEMLGKDYFNQRAMPDALIKLTQMFGRLMRRESDRGRITVFDKRLHTTKWGQVMLSALPNFTKEFASTRKLRAVPRDSEVALSI